MNQKNYLLYAVLGLLLVASFIFWRSPFRPEKNQKSHEVDTIIVGTNAEYQPFTYLDESGDIIGFDIDIAREVANRLGKTIEFHDRPFDTLTTELQLGYVHFAAAGITPTAERANNVFFTEPYFEKDPLMILTTINQKPLNSMKELAGKTVVVNEGFTADEFASKHPDLNVVRLATVSDAFLALKSGKVDAFISAKSSVSPFMKANQKELYHAKPIPLNDIEEQYSIAIAKRYPHLVDPIEKALEEMKREGTIERLKKKWGLTHD